MSNSDSENELETVQTVQVSVFLRMQNEDHLKRMEQQYSVSKKNEKNNFRAIFHHEQYIVGSVHSSHRHGSREYGSRGFCRRWNSRTAGRASPCLYWRIRTPSGWIIALTCFLFLLTVRCRTWLRVCVEGGAHLPPTNYFSDFRVIVFVRTPVRENKPKWDSETSGMGIARTLVLFCHVSAYFLRKKLKEITYGGGGRVGRFSCGIALV